MKLAPALCLFALSCTCFAQKPGDLDFLTRIGEFRSVRTTLSEYLKTEAMRLIGKREAAVASLSSAAGMERRRDLLRRTVLGVLGGLPERTPLNARVVGTLERSGYRIEKVIFESQPRFYVTANLYIPTRGTPPFPAILYPLGHEPGGKAYPVWQQMLGSLAQKGFVALTWDPLGQGERSQFYDPDWQDSKLPGSTVEHTVLGTQCLLIGDHIARYTIFDGLRALDYLISRKEVDPSRIGCTGNSGGGTHTTYLSALDDRIQAAAPSCYISSWRRMLESLGPQDAEQVFPFWLANGLDYPDFLYSFGLKPFLILSAIRDFFPIDGARETFAEAQRVFTAAGAAEKLAFFDADDGHGYTEPRRMRAYNWFRRWLQKTDDSGSEPRVELSTAEELNCTETGQVATALGGETVYTLNIKRLEQRRAKPPRLETAADLERQRENVRGAARELSRYEPPAGQIRFRNYGVASEPGYRMEKIVLDTEPGLPLPALLMAPEGGRARKPAIIFADGEGKAAAWEHLRALVRAGFVVLAIDLRGMGETRPELPRGDNFAHYFGDHDNAMTALLIGKTMIGMRARDVVRAFAFLAARPEVEPASILGFGRGAAASAVLYAAIFEPRISGVALEGMLESYESIVRNRIHRQVLEQIVPGALLRFDLPDLVGALAPRPVWIAAARTPLGQQISAAALRRSWTRPLEAYRISGAAAALHFVEVKPGESFAAGYAGLLTLGKADLPK